MKLPSLRREKQCKRMFIDHQKQNCLECSISNYFRWYKTTSFLSNRYCFLHVAIFSWDLITFHNLPNWFSVPLSFKLRHTTQQAFKIVLQCNVLCINARIKHSMVYWLSVTRIDRVSRIKKFISDMVRKSVEVKRQNHRMFTT